MTAHTQPELRQETETGPTEAKVGRIISVVVSIVAVCAGTFIVTAEPSRRIAPAIHGVPSTKMAVVVPHLSNVERSFAVTRHKTVAKSARFGALHQDPGTPRAVAAPAGRRADAVARVAQTRTVVVRPIDATTPPRD